jgi:hypothetical protein
VPDEAWAPSLALPKKKSRCQDNSLSYPERIPETKGIHRNFRIEASVVVGNLCGNRGFLHGLMTLKTEE